MWRESNPQIISVIQASLQSFRHELLVSNFKGIPLMLQHGGADDNVPVFHSRRMNHLISNANGEASCGYSELEGKGHWFDGVMVTSPLRKIYDTILDGRAALPTLPQSFTIVVANPADMGFRGGLVVDQLDAPNQLGKVEVVVESTLKLCTLKTSNVSRFHFDSGSLLNMRPSILVIDDQLIEMSQPLKDNSWMVHSENSYWEVSIRIETVAIAHSHRFPKIPVGFLVKGRDLSWDHWTQY